MRRVWEWATRPVYTLVDAVAALVLCAVLMLLLIRG